MTDAAVVELLRELVSIDSVNPSLVPGAAGEAEIVAYLRARLERSGFTTTVIDAQQRPSLLAGPPNEREPAPSSSTATWTR